jgi:hypothetical protein
VLRLLLFGTLVLLVGQLLFVGERLFGKFGEIRASSAVFLTNADRSGGLEKVSANCGSKGCGDLYLSGALGLLVCPGLANLFLYFLELFFGLDVVKLNGERGVGLHTS